MARSYYTLAVRWHEVGLTLGHWTPEFGDYDEEVVEEERRYYRIDHGHKAKDLKIIRTGDTQAEIDAGIAKLNAKEK
jgi:hypothetical protein